MSSNDADGHYWASRRICLTAMLSQTLGVSTLLYLPHLSVISGALGHVLMLFVVYIVIGIPLFYMENVVGQFTGRDCLEVWRARACLSHVGYLQIVHQIMLATYLHAVNSFVVHYFLISFENPIPYYVCGKWSKPDCDIINYNYTINEDCLKLEVSLPYCFDLCHSFPEYQYWRFNILGMDKNMYYLPWRIGLASGLLTIVLFLSGFKRVNSLKWILLFVTVYPVSARFLFLIGSMLQKGVVVKYDDAFDTDFSLFTKQVSVTTALAEMLFSLNVGTGLAFGSASKTSFRAPCYSNTVIVVIITCFVTILGICSTAMMTCPYAFKYNIKPGLILRYPISNSFEKIPRLLYPYEARSFWLIISYSFIAVSAICGSICIFSNFLEMLSKRFPKVNRNPNLVAFALAITLYVGTAPMLGNLFLYYLVDTKTMVNLLALFLLLMENIVFVLWYGLGKFSEDVHFMQGVQPNAFVKVCWVVSAATVVYVFCSEFYVMYTLRNKTVGYTVGWYLLLLTIVPTLLLAIVRVLVSLYKNKLHEEIRLDPTWGPKSEVLKRSRAMFTAQAMTKEYMYRQYHLQAGILKRQKRSNVRCFHQLGTSKV